MTSELPVTQADRDAADAHFDIWYPDTAWGFDALAEAFARHRLAERAKIVAWLRGQDGHGYDAMRAECIEAGEHLK